jgi:hypothetical protein
LGQVLMMTSSRRIMGPAFVNTRLTSVATWAIAAMVMAINAYLCYSFVVDNLLGSHASVAAVAVAVIAYVSLLGYLVVGRGRLTAAGADAETRGPAVSVDGGSPAAVEKPLLAGGVPASL